HLDQRIKLQVTRRRNRLGAAGPRAVTRERGAVGAERLPAGAVLGRAGERIAQRFLDTHAGVWIAALLPLRHVDVRLPDVFAERELDAGRRTLEDQALRRQAVAELDRHALSADRVRRAMQHQRARDAAGQLPV